MNKPYSERVALLGQALAGASKEDYLILIQEAIWRSKNHPFVSLNDTKEAVNNAFSQLIQINEEEKADRESNRDLREYQRSFFGN